MNNEQLTDALNNINPEYIYEAAHEINPECRRRLNKNRTDRIVRICCIAGGSALAACFALVMVLLNSNVGFSSNAEATAPSEAAQCEDSAACEEASDYASQDSEAYLPEGTYEAEESAPASAEEATEDYADYNNTEDAMEESNGVMDYAEYITVSEISYLDNSITLTLDNSADYENIVTGTPMLYSIDPATGNKYLILNEEEENPFEPVDIVIPAGDSITYTLACDSLPELPDGTYELSIADVIKTFTVK